MRYQSHVVSLRQVCLFISLLLLPFPHVIAADMVTTFAGSTGKGSQAQFRSPWGICMNPRDKCMYVCEYGSSRIRRISMEGISAQIRYLLMYHLTFASGDVSTFYEPGCPSAIVMNHKDNVFFMANNNTHTISKITASGTSVFSLFIFHCPPLSFCFSLTISHSLQGQ